MMNFKKLLNRCINSYILEHFTKIGYIRYNSNSYDLYSYKKNSKLRSFNSKKEANFYINKYGVFDDQKEKEIIVWLRLQKDLDKQQYIEYAKDKFNISDLDAERIYYIAFPDGNNFYNNDKYIVELQNNLNNIPTSQLPELLDLLLLVTIGEKYIDELYDYDLNPNLIINNMHSITQDIPLLSNI